MGQRIDVAAVLLGEVAIFDSDRSLTGQDGSGFSKGDELDDAFPARLAGRVFEADPEADHVFVASSQVVVRRSGPWDEAAAERISSVIRELLVFYA
jgi:hypothetical protein